MDATPKGAGKSSYELVDPNLVFEQLALEEHTVFLDIACGFGKYALKAAEIIGEGGIVYAIDLWPQGVASLLQTVAVKNFANIWASVGDVSRRLPLKDSSVDVCLLATVLHDLVQAGVAGPALKEIARVIKPAGDLFVIEFEKIDGPPGPPVDIRLTGEEIVKIVAPFGFQAKQCVSVGRFNSLTGFVSAIAG